MADKLIPGIPLNTRITLLQQTGDETSSDHTVITASDSLDPGSAQNLEKLTALNYVIESDVQRSHYQRDVEGRSLHLFSARLFIFKLLRNTDWPIDSAFESF